MKRSCLSTDAMTAARPCAPMPSLVCAPMPKNDAASGTGLGGTRRPVVCGTASHASRRAERTRRRDRERPGRRSQQRLLCVKDIARRDSLWPGSADAALLPRKGKLGRLTGIRQDIIQVS